MSKKESPLAKLARLLSTAVTYARMKHDPNYKDPASEFEGWEGVQAMERMAFQYVALELQRMGITAPDELPDTAPAIAQKEPRVKKPKTGAKKDLPGQTTFA